MPVLHSERLKYSPDTLNIFLKISCDRPFNIHHGVKGAEDGRASDGEADPRSEAGQDLNKKGKGIIVVEAVKELI
jgi:hypothetical protein